MTRRNGRHHKRGPRANASGLATHQPDGHRFAGQDRTFGPGLSAGQAGVQTLGGAGKRGPMAVQTYGSLGYASMGDGSMDMAIRGALGRTFAETPNEEGRRFSDVGSTPASECTVSRRSTSRGRSRKRRRGLFRGRRR